MKMNVLLGVTVVVVVLGAPARADDEPAVDRTPRSLVDRDEPSSSFVAPGRVVLDDVFGVSVAPLPGGGDSVLGVRGGWFGIASAKSETHDGTTEASLLTFAPSADFFLFGGFSVGGTIQLARQTTKTSGARMPDTEVTTTSRSIAPRVGYAIPIARDIVVWPRVFFGVGTATTEVRSGASASPLPLTTAPSAEGELWSVGVDVPIVFALTRMVLLGVGPRFVYAHQTYEPVGLPDQNDVVASSASLGASGSLRLAF